MGQKANNGTLSGHKVSFRIQKIDIVLKYAFHFQRLPLQRGAFAGAEREALSLNWYILQEMQRLLLRADKMKKIT